jgi:hypothetical protein
VDAARTLIRWDGATLSLDGRGRRFAVDPRVLGPGLPAWAHICASVDDEAALRFDEPEVQQVRRDALAWWIPLLGDELVCLTMLTVDDSLCGGAITVARSVLRFQDDPFARLFPGTMVETELFQPVAPPPGPLVERVGGLWPSP